jgi:hypothetical protein
VVPLLHTRIASLDKVIVAVYRAGLSHEEAGFEGLNRQGQGQLSKSTTAPLEIFSLGVKQVTTLHNNM